MNKKFLMILLLGGMMLTSCTSKPQNVRELIDTLNEYTISEESPSYDDEITEREQSNESEGEIVWSECPLCSGNGRCALCFGSGRCGGCGGIGKVYDAIYHSPGEYIDCNACNGSGACGNCGGSGTCPACNGKGKDVVLKDD